eukprot:TRINITY_DN46792_c0_g1_i2.p1 TRINITY_DN46792_c0_g1~~TRINITY_DN46792_c0_g1_i2.p1  ORF type:complete len:213 (+),score=69.78 TRINITY_DN46792_c0_g1_i2:96-641(+)
MSNLQDSVRSCLLDLDTPSAPRRMLDREVPTQQLRAAELAQFSSVAGSLEPRSQRAPSTAASSSQKAAASPDPSSAAAAASEEDPLTTAMRELESLQIALSEEKSKNTQLREDLHVAEVNHQRDVETLEGMLQAVIKEKDELAKQLFAYKATSGSDKILDWGCSTIKESEDEPEMEPRRAP